MITANINIEYWKLNVFKEHLTDQGYRFAVHESKYPDKVTIKTTAESIIAIRPTLVAANKACEELASENLKGETNEKPDTNSSKGCKK